MASRSAGRKGRPWRRARAQVLAISTLCHLCGHEGSGDVDHRIPLREWIRSGGHPEDLANLAPAHGALSRCWTCDPVKGKACNQAKGARPARRLTTSRAW